jgi:hypothetical protein
VCKLVLLSVSHFQSFGGSRIILIGGSRSSRNVEKEKKLLDLLKKYFKYCRGLFSSCWSSDPLDRTTFLCPKII